MQQMTAIAITRPGGPEVLQPVKIAVPVPGPGQVLVHVKAAGINRPDVLQRTIRRRRELRTRPALRLPAKWQVLDLA